MKQNDIVIIFINHQKCNAHTLLLLSVSPFRYVLVLQWCIIHHIS